MGSMSQVGRKEMNRVEGVVVRDDLIRPHPGGAGPQVSSESC